MTPTTTARLLVPAVAFVLGSIFALATFLGIGLGTAVGVETVTVLGASRTTSSVGTRATRVPSWAHDRTSARPVSGCGRVRLPGSY